MLTDRKALKGHDDLFSAPGVCIRLAVAFFFAMALHAIVIFGEPYFPRTMQAFGSAFGSVLVPAGVFLFVIYRSSFLAHLSAPCVRVLRFFACGAISVAFAFASMFAVLVLWFLICWTFGLPVRQA
jgi:hypothetical protein